MCNSSGNVVKEQKQMLAHSRGSLSSLMYSGFHSWIAVLWKDFNERKLKFNVQTKLSGYQDSYLLVCPENVLSFLKNPLG